MTIEELHDKLYDLLQIIDKICKENGIRYFVHAGTEIGAVREKDFIPWDDDMDIKVLSEDYPLFREVMKKKLPEHLHLIEPQDFSPFFYDFVFKIVDDRWLLRKETKADRAYKNNENRVGVDVFVCTGCPNNIIGQKIFILKHKILYGMAMRYRYELEYSKYTKLQRIQVKLLRCIGRIYSGKTPDRIMDLWYRFISSYDAEKTGWRININSPLGNLYLKPMPNQWFKETTQGKIRELAVPIIREYDKELQLIYGNYMIPERDTTKYFTHLE